MSEKSIFMSGQTLRLNYPPQAAAAIEFVFPDNRQETGDNSLTTIKISYNSNDKLFTVTDGKKEISSKLNQDDLALFLLSRTSYSLANSIHRGIAVQGAAVHRDGNGLLMPGKTGSGKSILTSWLLAHGFAYLTDSLASISEDSFQLNVLTTPIHIKQSALDELSIFSPLHRQPALIRHSRNSLLFSHKIFNDKPVHHSPDLSLFLFIEHLTNTPLVINAMSPAQAARQLMGSFSNGKNLKLHGLHQVAALTRKIPALTLQYSDLDQLEDVLEPIIDFAFESNSSPSLLNTFIRAFHRIIVKKNNVLPTEHPETTVEITTSFPTFPLQKATAKKKNRKKRKLTIGMATYDDYDGVYFSVQALRLYHPEIINECEILVVDNHPDGPCAESLKNIDRAVENYRYVPLLDVQGTAVVRDCVFQHAEGDHVLCIDCHVFIVPGAIKKLLDYYNADSNSNDLLQGPMIHDDLKTISTHFDPVWSGGMYGTWGHDVRGDDPDGEPFDIPMQGVGLFSCRRKAWPKFNAQFYGFGADEGYIHEKFRQAGGRTLCLPFLRWLHRFGRPMGVPYPIQWKDRIHNYLVGFKELGLDTAPVKAHFIEFLGKEPATDLFQEIEAETSLHIRGQRL